MVARVYPGASINRVLNINGPIFSKKQGFYPVLGAMVLGYAQVLILTHYDYLICNNFSAIQKKSYLYNQLISVS
jgi:hypothetical protein